MTSARRLLITPGEPAGIGPDITVKIAQLSFRDDIIAVADPDLLRARAEALHLPLHILPFDEQAAPIAHEPGTLRVLPHALATPCTPGKLDVRNAHYVLDCLRSAAAYCLEGKAQALITGPVQKSVMNEANIPFTGHTEFLAEVCGVAHSVMLFVTDTMKVALLTTHLPLADVPKQITQERIHLVVRILHQALQTRFHIANPRLLIAGLNPHAGENGHLGREELDIMIPALQSLTAAGINVRGPYAADTLFTDKLMQEGDAILALYHDQALPVVKYASLGAAVNMTLGLPILRTSVDHGTALDVAGLASADPSSLIAAIHLASRLA